MCDNFRVLVTHLALRVSFGHSLTVRLNCDRQVSLLVLPLYASKNR